MNEVTDTFLNVITAILRTEIAKFNLKTFTSLSWRALTVSVLQVNAKLRFEYLNLLSRVT